MGLLAQKRVLFVLIFFSLGSYGWADEYPFHLTAVDYFGLRRQDDKKVVFSPDWVEPGYHPPQVVMDLLDDPNEQTALAYLRWQRERFEKIARAQQVLDKVTPVSLAGAY